MGKAIVAAILKHRHRTAAVGQQQVIPFDTGGLTHEPHMGMVANQGVADTQRGVGIDTAVCQNTHIAVLNHSVLNDIVLAP